MSRRTSAVVLALPLALVVGGVASAAWTTSGTGSGAGSARSLLAPTAPSAATVSPTSSAIDVSFTPAANPTGTTYTVTRDKTKAGAVGATVACSGLTASPCHDTGLAPSTTYTYTVSAVVGSWTRAAATTPTATTAAAPVVNPTVSSPTTASPVVVPKGTSGTSVVVTGTGFLSGLTATVTTSNGFSITAVAVNSSTQVTLTVTAPTGNGKLDSFRLTNTDGGTVTCTSCLKSSN